MLNLKLRRDGLWLCLVGLSGCAAEPADLKVWQQTLASRPPLPLPDWPNAPAPYLLAPDAPATLTLFHPEQRQPSTPAHILVFYPLSQLSYVGYIRTPTQHWAIIHTPQGPQLATQGALIGLESWSLERIDAAALTLSPNHPNAVPTQLALSPTPPPAASAP
ncbi:MAG: hypothetical protein KBC57_08520 [Neisseriaceae bacterium]|nr:hypothetical protein [Neisseriaceae bacterium]MBP6862388.1 hypothetical protein [Neisseriaceae bacterium]